MIIGITGTNGAGKGTVVEYLVQTKGFAHYSARAFLLEEISSRGMVPNRDSLNLVGNDLRREHGPQYTAQALLERAKREGGDAIIESIRNIGEAEFLKSHGAKIFAVDADRAVRYERISSRGDSTDNVTFEEFCAQEDREMNSNEMWDMNIQGVIRLADVLLINNGSKEDLNRQIEEALTRL
jgi:dephospho-CoA kinase